MENTALDLKTASPAPTSERMEVLKLLTLLQPFHKLSPRTYFVDLSISATVFWGSIWLAGSLELGSVTIALVILGFLAAYRSFSFMHEVVHFQKRIKFLSPMWNAFVGYPCLFPSLVHEPHLIHHMPKYFGTAKDPEYISMKGKGMKLAVFPVVMAIMMIPLLLVRFGVLPLVSWMFGSRFRETLYRRFSTQVVNPGFVREIQSEKDLTVAQRHELFCSLSFVAWIALYVSGLVTIQFFACLVVALVGVAGMNIYRARIAHLYDKEDQSTMLSPFELIRDSVSVEGGWLTMFWAPAGVQYHSLHHIDPAIPYHNLRAAHRSLRAQLPADNVYLKTVQPTFWSGMQQFFGIISKK